MTVKLITLFVVGEVIIHLLFFAISRSIGKSKRDGLSFSTFLKGILERTYIVVVLFMDIASALTLLGALKIATRIKDEENKVSNDFFLMGNLISILFGIAYSVLLTKILS